jgi:hypothetical protein
MPHHAQPPPRFPLAFITRMSKPFLWRVWITFGHIDCGQVYFSDREHGSKEASLLAAQHYRDLAIDHYRIPLRAYDGNGYYVQHRHNSSGMIGVVLMRDTPDKPTRVRWAARFMREGKQKVCSFSIRKYGYREAYRRAAEIRSRHTGQPPQPLPKPPPWLVGWAESYKIDLTQ